MQSKRLFARVFSLLACLSLLLASAPAAQAAAPTQEPAPVAPASPDVLSSISGKVKIGGAPLSGVKVTATQLSVAKPKIILLPGVMGSLLEAKSKDGCSSRQVGVAWIDIRKTIQNKWDIFAPDLLDTLALNDGGAQSANNCDAIEPKGLIDTYGLLSLKDVYSGLIASLQAEKYVVLSFPYDWRLSIDSTVGKLDAFVDANKGPAGKVILVGHSMGGLVARAYVADSGRAAKVDKVITVATPYLGAPKLAYVMMTGKADLIGEDKEYLMGPVMGQVKTIVRNAPGALQLLPSRTYVDAFPYYTAFGKLMTTYAATNAWFVEQGKNQLLLAAADSFHQRLDSFTNNYPFTGEYWILAARNRETILDVVQKRCFSSSFTCYDFTKYALGDGTVPQVSSRLLANGALTGAAKVCTYPSNVAIYDHSAVMADPIIRNDIKKILAGAPPVGCVLNGQAQSAAAEAAPSMRQVTIWGEADVRVEDGSGHFAGIDASGLYTSTLPDVSMDFPPNSTVVLLPTNAPYRLTARSLSGLEPTVTVADFAAPDVESALTAQGRTLFTAVPVGQGGVIVLPAAGAPLAQLTLALDANADGTPEQILPPDAVLTDPTQAQDVTMPSSAITLAGAKDAQGRFTGNATATVAAQDNAGGSGLLASWYSLNGGGTWQKYSAPVQVPFGAAASVQVYSTDKAGNQEYPPKEQPLAFEVAPVKLFLPAIRGPNVQAAAQSVAQPATQTEPAAPEAAPLPIGPQPAALAEPAVVAAPALAWTAYTIADGTYSFANLPAGNYEVTAEKSGYTMTPAKLPVVVVVGSEAKNKDFTATLFSATDMKLIPAGSFQMGCETSDDPLCNQYGHGESLRHAITLSTYAIDTYEVTNARYAACVAAGNCTAPQSTQAYSTSRGYYDYYGVAQYANFPVINVDWHQATAFCAWDNKRLPTEAEWEKAARGSSDTRIYPWGNQTPDCTLGNFYNDATGNYCVGETTAVGAYPSGASPYGVMDMSGNVWEWVNDWWDGNYYATSPANDPQGPATGSFRVLRGGSFLNDYRSMRASFRGGDIPGNWGDYLGFRCVRSQ